MKTRQISAWVMAGLVMSAAFTSCKKDDDVATLPPIGGYNTSNDVAASNLKAHWTFDGTNNETISGTAPSNSSNASFTTGTKGQALQLNSGYLLYPTITALSSASAIPSVTVSSWVKVANNGTTASSVFALTQALSAQGDWNQGPLNMYVETGAYKAASDTLQLHSAFHTFLNGNYSTGGDNVTGFGLADAGKTYQIVKGANKWVHYVMVYDGSSSNIDLYANGQLVSNSTYRNRTVNGVGIGPITLATPTQVVIGAWPNANAGYTQSAAQAWQGLFNGSIDEIRVYNKALSGTDIGYLYQLESAGR
ncbi:LamG domain-containing protein [Spirosoma sp. KCTC 42546]|uniref:LamG-like jellyroll fold domain-containing protein n=1 Tax=Spirosoma sp. KCTC 42546 TaxID=2520506 RepID=UPI00115BAC23|nr:LamG-like jellyroll fold domain-containing protein [Spirosoma sp. KCTC 42546]QDK77671.1 LamG domain-containing protein [Spirosoma sp. KCTC 42546]